MSLVPWYQAIINEITTMSFAESDMYLRSNLCLYCMNDWNENHECSDDVTHSFKIQEIGKRIVSYRSKASNGFHCLQLISSDLQDLFCTGLIENFPPIVQVNAPTAFKKLFAVAKQRFDRDVLLEEANVIMNAEEAFNAPKGCWFCYDITHNARCLHFREVQQSPYKDQIKKYGWKIVENMNEKVFWQNNKKQLIEFQDTKVANIEDSSKDKRLEKIDDIVVWMNNIIRSCR